MKFIQHQHFYLSLVTGQDVTQNISTTCPANAGAESPGTLCTILRNSQGSETKFIRQRREEQSIVDTTCQIY